MTQETNHKYKELFTTLKHYVILMGGRGAGRSTVVSQYFLSKLIAPEYFRGAIMRFILSDIRNSCFQEILDRAEEQGITENLDIDKTSMTIAHGANVIHAHAFRKSSGDQKAKLKSLANYSEVWIEEADEVPQGDFMQLDDSLRTVKAQIKVILTLNAPPKSHWIIVRWFNLLASGVEDFFLPECKHDDVLYIRTDWHDNAQNISEGTKKRYEEYKETKPAHYWNMIRGYVPETVQGKIYQGWKEIEEVPHEARLERTGVDFGWDPDPATGIDVYYYNGGYIFDEVFYQTEMRNADIGNRLIAKERKALVVADSAEPKSIAELLLMGVNVVACEKGADSIAYGIGVIQSERISFTKRSVHLKYEYENYAWKVRKSDDVTLAGEPKEGNDHCLDAARYAMTSLVPVVQRRDMIANMPRVYEDDASDKMPAR